MQLAWIPAGRCGGYVFRAEEIKQTAFRLDGLLMPPEGSDAPLIFLEAQAQPDEDFYGRFFAELFLYLQRNAPRRPWRALVIYPQRAGRRALGSALRRSLSVTERTTGLSGRFSRSSRPLLWSTIAAIIDRDPSG